MFKNTKGLYYAVASLGGLFLIVVGLVIALQATLSNYALKAPKQSMSIQPPDLKSYVGDLSVKEGLTNAQKDALAEWQQDYNKWREDQKNFDWQSAGQKSQYSFAGSMLLVGIPIFLYHIRFVRKEKD